MKSIFHPSAQRGHNTFSWLDSHHSFSFGHYFDESRIHFGALRVLNDDVVAPGSGFGTHPHDNMEIVSIPLQGALEHRDSMGNHGTIEYGDVQIMSAGTGIQHSEYNHSKSEYVKFLQIWVFPNEHNLTPGYDQKKFDAAQRQNQWQILVSPQGGDDGVKIHQNAWFSMAKIDAGKSLDYTLHGSGQGTYLFVLSGKVLIDGQVLGARDAMGIWETNSIAISSSEDAELLAIEIPMEFQ